MKQLLDLIKKDTTRWEFHTLLENLADDFQVCALLRARHSAQTQLLTFGNDLMQVTVGLHRDAESATWAVRGHLLIPFSIHHDTYWPEKLLKRYISAARAADDLFISCCASLEALDDLWIETFNAYWDGDQFDTGQFLTVLKGDLVFGGNCYPQDLPPSMTARLFRADLALALTCLLWPYAGYFRGMLPRPIDGATIRTPLERLARELYTVAPSHMSSRRVPLLGHLHAEEVERVERKSAELKYGAKRVAPPEEVVDFSSVHDWKTCRDTEHLLEQGELAAATAQLHRHLGLYPTSLHCRRKLARIYLWLDQPLKALPELGRLTDIYLGRSWPGAALQLLEKMLALAPDDPRIFIRLADIHARTGLVSTATRELQKGGAAYLKRGDEAGLELFRERMVRLWWDHLASVENLTARQMLRLDFHRDFGFNNRDSIRQTKPSPPWKPRHGIRSSQAPIPIDALRAITSLKQQHQDV